MKFKAHFIFNVVVFDEVETAKVSEALGLPFGRWLRRVICVRYAGRTKTKFFFFFVSD